jgi:hypothetical protein
MAVIGSSDKCLSLISELRMRFPYPASPLPPGTRASVPRSVRGAGRSAHPWQRMSGLPAGLLLAAAAASLGACARPDAFAPACPRLALLPDGADLTRFAGTGHDITDLVLDAHLTAVPASCRWANDAHKQVEAKLQVTMTVSRGPAMPGRTIDVPYFVAVGEGDTIYDKQINTGRVDFPANTDRLNLTSSEISLLFPVSHEKSAAAYKIWVSFQLTPDELALNRSRTPP